MSFCWHRTTENHSKKSKSVPQRWSYKSSMVALCYRTQRKNSLQLTDTRQRGKCCQRQQIAVRWTISKHQQGVKMTTILRVNALKVSENKKCLFWLSLGAARSNHFHRLWFLRITTLRAILLVLNETSKCRFWNYRMNPQPRKWRRSREKWKCES